MRANKTAGSHSHKARHRVIHKVIGQKSAACGELTRVESIGAQCPRQGEGQNTKKGATTHKPCYAMNPDAEHEIGASWDCGAPWLNRGVRLVVKELWVYAVIPAKRW
jgi:hypothetical protein